jgi:hypothetical protein
MRSLLLRWRAYAFTLAVGTALLSLQCGGRAGATGGETPLDASVDAKQPSRDDSDGATGDGTAGTREGSADTNDVAEDVPPNDALDASDAGATDANASAQEAEAQPPQDGAGADADATVSLAGDAALEAGTCATSADCNGDGSAAGRVCENGRCTACTSDGICSGDPYYSVLFARHGAYSAMCNMQSGQCVSPFCQQAGASCGSASNGNRNPADVCCLDIQLVCIPGDCCSDGDCPKRHTCVALTCVPSCTGLPNGGLPTYFVDPVNGVDDSMTNGASTCPFRTLGRAIAVATMWSRYPTIAIVNDPVAPTLGTASGETFPIHVPPNVVIRASNLHGSAPVLLVPPGQTGLVADDSGITVTLLIIDGQNHQATTGIAIYGGPATGQLEGGAPDLFTSSLDNVTIENTLGPAMVIGPAPGQTTSPGNVGLSATVLTGSGTQAAPASGLSLSGLASVGITGGRGAQHSSFGGNTQYGILVTGGASIGTEGTIDPAPDNNDIDADGNAMAGVWIAQDPTRQGLALNTVSGLHASKNPVGIHVTAGSLLQLRSSYVGDNARAGIVVATAGTPVDDLTTIDLGTRHADDFGQNVLLAPGSSSTGLCMQVGPNVRTLVAAGNIFGAVDCGADGGTLRRSTNCNGNADIGGLNPSDLTTVDVSLCK